MPVSSVTPSLPLPPGSDRIVAWAKARGFAHVAYPDERWFRAWEPFDTMVSAGAYLNSVSWPLPPGSVTVVEPWLAPLDSEPLDRTAMIFVTHPGFTRRAAARGGEFFNTRVAYFESAPPPRVELGDPAWDQHMSSFAASPADAAAAFPVAARRLLAAWRFSGHLELRPGGLVAHFAGMRPTPEDLEHAVRAVPALVTALLSR